MPIDNIDHKVKDIKRNYRGRHPRVDVFYIWSSYNCSVFADLSISLKNQFLESALQSEVVVGCLRTEFGISLCLLASR